ncbi:methyltransferase-like protein 24 [Pollicipes pollicipes]|uniref:methyltransferase-like protein 24 n=1 Tax=Pollicipes pollicipes TaxID=41117 RepID=UPI00188593DE|nr:methyltransferase-like protein 24 [Pollicipes pollicipes]XP_037082801.1 methyltransferase-like protein 24 [Pollicipes pollicipes]
MGFFCRNQRPWLRMAAYVAMGAVATLLVMMFYTDRSVQMASGQLTAPLDELSLEELVARLEHMLSPANERVRCRSAIFPGGKCSCVDATPGDEESCLLVPIADGSKTVCLDDGLLTPGQPCLVYSFGIRDDLSFETEMVRFGCTVHAFDPTVRLNRTAAALPDALHVHYLGIDGHSWTHRVDGREFRLLTLDALVRHLGHEGVRIDYLKLDAEGSEWSVLRDQLGGGGGALRRLPQFTVELHLLFPRGTLSADPSRQLQLSHADALGFLQTLHALEEAGFRLMESRPDTSKFAGTGLSYIYETTWVRQR